MTAPIFNIVGQKIALGPLDRTLVPAYQRWNNDFETTRTLARSWPTTLEAETQAYEAMATSADGVFFTVYELASSTAIGLTYLWPINFVHRTAEFGIVIGEAEYRGRGYGTETTALLLAYAFQVLGLHSVTLKVYAYNGSGVRAYEKAGFRTFGLQREGHQRGGRLWDIVHMQCLAREFSGPTLPFAHESWAEASDAE